MFSTFVATDLSSEIEETRDFMTRFSSVVLRSFIFGGEFSLVESTTRWLVFILPVRSLAYCIALKN